MFLKVCSNMQGVVLLSAVEQGGKGEPTENEKSVGSEIPAKRAFMRFSGTLMLL